jgi:hypothetical protein
MEYKLQSNIKLTYFGYSEIVKELERKVNIDINVRIHISNMYF